MYKLRQYFAAAEKIKLEDDITASVVVPRRYLPTLPESSFSVRERSYKFVANCEYRLFQRPDDAIHRGLDKQTELDIADVGNFFCNFEPLSREVASLEVANIIEFEQYTAPMQNRMSSFIAGTQSYVVSSAQPRIVDGKPTKNPRYLQDRSDLLDPFDRYVAFRGMQLYRATPAGHSVPTPVNAILSGRRNNPPDRKAGIRSLAVFSPIHYQELPELIMDYVCSLTGKSPSTTGAGSEGALTKGPFNALNMVYDLNSTIVSMILTGLGGFSTAAGHIGPDIEVGHDISMFVPEIWCRLRPEEREPEFLMKEGLLERIEDFHHNGVVIPASRLGYRITARFVRRYFGRVFDNPSKVFDDRILCPEKQDIDSYADGILHIAEAQKRVAEFYLNDGSFNIACPPLQALLKIMAEGSWQGMGLNAPKLRTLFTRENLESSTWYAARLAAKQRVDQRLWQRHTSYLAEYCSRPTHAAVTKRLGLLTRLEEAKSMLATCCRPDYLDSLRGTLGVDPSL